MTNKIQSNYDLNISLNETPPSQPPLNKPSNPPIDSSKEISKSLSPNTFKNSLKKAHKKLSFYFFYIKFLYKIVKEYSLTKHAAKPFKKTISLISYFLKMTPFLLSPSKYLSPADMKTNLNNFKKIVGLVKQTLNVGKIGGIKKHFPGFNPIIKGVSNLKLGLNISLLVSNLFLTIRQGGVQELLTKKEVKSLYDTVTTVLNIYLLFFPKNKLSAHQNIALALAGFAMAHLKKC